MKKLKIKRWKDHPWNNNNQVEEIKISFIEKIRNKESLPTTDDIDGIIKSQSVVFDNIEKNGMRDPLLIVISSKYKTIRLEAGNHRIQEAKKRGYTHLPVAVLVIDEHYLKEGNGKHYYSAEDIVNFKDVLKIPYPYQIQLKSVIKNLSLIN